MSCSRCCTPSILTFRDSSRGRSPITLACHAAGSRRRVDDTLVAALALGLALVGLYSLVSFLVAERTHEIGLRMALGAAPVDVLRLVLGYGIKLAGIGLAIGVPVAAAASRLLGSLLYGVSPTDPLVFVAVSVTSWRSRPWHAACRRGGRCVWIRCWLSGMSRDVGPVPTSGRSAPV